MAPRSKNTLAKAAGAEPWPDERLKIARRCGTKHISKSKGAKHTRFGPLLEVDMSKKCTPLWLEAHVQVKCTKHTMLGPLLEDDMSKKCSHCGAKHISKSKCIKTPHARTTFEGSDVVLRGSARGILYSVKSKQNMRTLSHFEKRWQARDI